MYAMKLSHLQKKAAQEIISTFIYRITHDERVAAIGWQDLENDVSPRARDLIDQIRSLNPKQYGSSRQRIKQNTGDDLVILRNQTFHTTSDSIKLPPRLLPAQTYHAFRRMNQQLKLDTGRKLVVKSGYRSPAYQLYIFLYNLKKHDWDTEKTLNAVALPGYSEHAGSPQAVDLRAKKHIGHEESYDFSRTAEFRWLKDNADDFGFSMSYQKNNGTGTQFEPWHWRHSKPISA
jgi:LAS superfamily LD-carboxypeptidase LdcB